MTSTAKEKEKKNTCGADNFTHKVNAVKSRYPIFCAKIKNNI